MKIFCKLFRFSKHNKSGINPATRIWVTWSEDEPVGVAFVSPRQSRFEYVLVINDNEAK